MKHGCWLILLGISLSLSSGCQSTSWKTAASGSPRKPAPNTAQANNTNSSRRSTERGESVDDRYLGKTPQELMVDGGRLEREQKFSEAVSVYKLVLRQDAQNGDAHHRLAILADLRKDYPTAETHYQKALAQKPANANILSDLGYSNYLRGNLKQAEQTLLQAIAADPQHIQAQNNLGQVYAEQGRYEDALATFRKVKPETEVQEVMAQLFPDRKAATEMASNQPPWAVDAPTDQTQPQSPMTQLTPKELAKLSPEQVKELMAKEREFSEQTRAARDRQMARQENGPNEIVTTAGSNWENSPANLTAPPSTATVPPWERGAATNGPAKPTPTNPEMGSPMNNQPVVAQNGAQWAGSPQATNAPTRGASGSPEDQMPFWAGGGASSTPPASNQQQPSFAQNGGDQLPVIQPAGTISQNALSRSTQPWRPATSPQDAVTQAANPAQGFDKGKMSWDSEPTIATNSSGQPPLQLAEATQDSWNHLNTTTPGTHPLVSNSPHANGSTSASATSSALTRAAQFGLQVGPGAMFMAPGFGSAPPAYPAQLNKSGNEYPQAPTYQLPPHGLSSNTGSSPSKVTPTSATQNWAGPWDQPKNTVQQVGGAVQPTAPNPRPAGNVVPAGAWSGNPPSQPGLNVNPFAEFRNKPAITPGGTSVGSPERNAQPPRTGQPQTIAWPPQSSANPPVSTLPQEPAPWPHAPQR